MSCVLEITSCVTASVLLVLVLERPDGLQHVVRGLADGEAPLLPPVHVRGEAVDLTDREPGQRGEDEVEEVLAHVDHDVLVLEDALLDHVPGEKENVNTADVVNLMSTYLSQPQKEANLLRPEGWGSAISLGLRLTSAQASSATQGPWEMTSEVGAA